MCPCVFMTSRSLWWHVTRGECQAARKPGQIWHLHIKNHHDRAELKHKMRYKFWNLQRKGIIIVDDLLQMYASSGWYQALLTDLPPRGNQCRNMRCYLDTSHKNNHPRIISVFKQHSPRHPPVEVRWADWSGVITWPGYWPLIGWEVRRAVAGAVRGL